MIFCSKFSTSILLFILLSFFSTSSVFAQILTQKQQDSAFLIHPGQLRIQKIKKFLSNTFKNYSSNELSLFGSIAQSKQTINDNAITIPVNYIYNTVNTVNYRTGFSGGFRIDGLYHQKHFYSFIFAINKVSVGNYYLNKYSLSPLLDEYTHFKSDNDFTTISIATHYKKIIPIGDINKYKFYAVIGSSIDYKISNMSNENLVNGAGNRAIINGDFGAEFNNKDYYILFAHYKRGINMFSSTVPIQLNRFEIGMSIKTKDIF